MPHSKQAYLGRFVPACHDMIGSSQPKHTLRSKSRFSQIGNSCSILPVNTPYTFNASANRQMYCLGAYNWQGRATEAFRSKMKMNEFAIVTLMSIWILAWFHCVTLQRDEILWMLNDFETFWNYMRQVLYFLPTHMDLLQHASYSYCISITWLIMVCFCYSVPSLTRHLWVI